MKEIVEKREVEELLGCEITDEQFEQALKYARHKQEYIYQREQREVVLQHWYLVTVSVIECGYFPVQPSSGCIPPLSVWLLRHWQIPVSWHSLYSGSPAMHS